MNWAQLFSRTNNRMLSKIKVKSYRYKLVLPQYLKTQTRRLREPSFIQDTSSSNGNANEKHIGQHEKSQWAKCMSTLPSTAPMTSSTIKGYSNKTGVESFWILLDGQTKHTCNSSTSCQVIGRQRLVLLPKGNTRLWERPREHSTLCNARQQKPAR